MATNRTASGVPRVGTLHVGTTQGYAGLLSKEGQHVFSYASDVVSDEDAKRSISLTMPIRTESYKTTLMLPVFQTFLPEGFLKDRIIEKFSKTLRVDDMALLALSGANAIGRIRLSQSRDTGPGNGGMESLREILADTASKDLFEYLCDRYLIASGIAGVQPKVMLEAHDDLETEAPARPRKSSLGEKSTLRGRNLIIKVSGSDYPHLTENEFHCLSIARSLKLPVPAFWLSDDRKRLAIERFDTGKEPGSFLGFEDMVSLQGKVNDRKYEGSYENIALAIRQNASPAFSRQSLGEFFSSLVLSVAVRNGDAHLKNFGLLYTHPESNDCRLSPLYDIVCTTMYLPADLPALSLARQKTWPTRQALASFGRDSCRVDDPEAVIDRIVNAATGYRPESDESGTWVKMKREIDAAARTLGRNRGAH
ncbi:MAG: type II toxin-antitoxin system HipA family toxin [Betaproteobacteria bacterium]|nr:type II toxin-antitoxin system HipA family toxin [Betaproteobacteria bacterium]